ncbi:transcription elongation regulator [Clydaea vesicula]|uniref:Transcription elongation regulator n=1 Tax=Clydaea vesicula TaxID=447962 RepID=A0AAD5U5C9_9FUNG|nr:transcription elongation regulator [Clydaea vesicula]
MSTSTKTKSSSSKQTPSFNTTNTNATNTTPTPKVTQTLPPTELQQVFSWIHSHLALVIAIVVIIFCTWLSLRIYFWKKRQAAIAAAVAKVNSPGVAGAQASANPVVLPVATTTDILLAEKAAALEISAFAGFKKRDPRERTVINVHVPASNAEDELLVTKGEVVVVLESFPNGYCRVYNTATAQTGLVPGFCLEGVQELHLLAISATAAYNNPNLSSPSVVVKAESPSLITPEEMGTPTQLTGKEAQSHVVKEDNAFYSAPPAYAEKDDTEDKSNTMVVETSPAEVNSPIQGEPQIESISGSNETNTVDTTLTPIDPFDPKGNDYNFIRESKTDNKKNSNDNLQLGIDLVKNDVENKSSDHIAENKTAKQPAKRHEEVVSIKKIPNSRWVIALTSRDHEFWHNRDLKLSVWDMPDELGEIIGSLMVEAFEESETEDRELIEENVTEMHEEVVVKKAPIFDEALSLEKRTALFNDLLKEKDISPFDTWEASLAKIINDRRYPLIKTLKERKDLFDLYCQNRARELKESNKKARESPKNLYLGLLKKFCNFRTTFDELTRKHRTDATFLGVKSQERKQLFDDYIKQLKAEEVERRTAEKDRIKNEFIELLRESNILTEKSRWDDVKHNFEKDSRSKAIRLNSEKQALFNEYIIELGVRDKVLHEKERMEKELRERKLREEESIKARLEEVNKQKKRLNSMNLRKGTILMKEEEEMFKNLLVDYVKSHLALFDDSIHIMEKDPRYKQLNNLTRQNKIRIFENYTESLLSNLTKSLSNLLEQVMEKTEILSVDWDIVYQLLKTNGSTIEKFRFEKDKVEENLKSWFENYKKILFQQCLEDYKLMLSENNFLKFFVKNEVQNFLSRKAEGEIDEEGDESVFDHIDLDQITKVLEEDNRYLVFVNFPDIQEQHLKKRVADLVNESYEEKGGTKDRTLTFKPGKKEEMKRSDKKEPTTVHREKRKRSLTPTSKDFSEKKPTDKSSFQKTSKSPNRYRTRSGSPSDRKKRDYDNRGH